MGHLILFLAQKKIPRGHLQGNLSLHKPAHPGLTTQIRDRFATIIPARKNQSILTFYRPVLQVPS